MTRNEFLQRLEAGLANVTPDERVAALQFYTEYFDDAGVEREASVLAELGDPDKLAADLCAVSGVETTPPPPQPEIVLTTATETEQQTIYGQPQPAQPYAQPQPGPVQQAPLTDSGAAFGMGAAPEAPQPEYQFPGGYVPPQYQMVQQPGVGYGQPQPVYNQRNTGIAILLVVLLVIFAAPLGGIAAAVLAILCVPFIVGISLTIAAIGVAIGGVALMGATVANGLVLLGIALALGAGGIALQALGVKIVATGGKAVARGVRAIWRGLTGKREGAYA